MGGVGKTTLAQLVYNHEMVTEYFDLKCWVYVSENFQLKEIIKKLIESIENCVCTETKLEMLQKSIQRNLSGKKFFIVLDVVWIESDESEKRGWEELSKTLRCGAEGSVVLMTTRSQTTSHMFAKVPDLQHNLECLSEEESWLLFEKLAFAEGRVGGNISELEPIGREIVGKCKGLPLAVKTMGSLMWSKRSTRDWEHVKDSIIWNLQETKVLPALNLSYDNLLPHLKRCFAYCCLFLKGYHMEKDVVIQLWVVNGFIPPRRGISLYVLGEDVFNCLVWRSFFQVVKAVDERKAINRYKMHDLMYDMARYVMGDDCLVIDPAYKEIDIPNHKVLHLSSSHPDFLSSPHDLENFKSLRSLLILECIDESNTIRQILNHMYLRVLYLPGFGLKKLPKSICKLKHLRYLNLSESDIEALPEYIILLQNLQVLILYHCPNLCILPEGLRYMTSLQHLDIMKSRQLKFLPLGIKDLTSLRMRLSNFPVGKETGAKIEELGDLNLLEGKLEISGLENLGDLSATKSANLKCKISMSVLKLTWSSLDEERTSNVFEYDEEVLEGLEPNPFLKKIEDTLLHGKDILSTLDAQLRELG